LIAVQASLQIAILSICLIAWLLGSIVLAFAAVWVPRDIATLRSQLEQRAQELRSGTAAD